jgi:hypothetical protein
MKYRCLVASLCALGSPLTARAHWLDQYLQATTITIGDARIVAQLRMTPGVTIVPEVLARIDKNGDGTYSTDEQRAYAVGVLHDVTLHVDGSPLSVEVLAVNFANIAEFQAGRGVIAINFAAQIPLGGVERQFTYVNRYEPSRSVYLANTLVPTDSTVSVTAQQRSSDQSRYGVRFTHTLGNANVASAERATGPVVWLGVGVLVFAMLFALRLARLGYTVRRRLQPPAPTP